MKNEAIMTQNKLNVPNVEGDVMCRYLKPSWLVTT